jgi:CheY-like chemotaxis protein
MRQVVLIVEDEALVRMTAVMVEEAGFEVLEATNADEAIRLLEARRDITVVFTDIEMPGSMTTSGSPRLSGAAGRPSRSSRHRAVT